MIRHTILLTTEMARLMLMGRWVEVSPHPQTPSFDICWAAMQRCLGSRDLVPPPGCPDLVRNLVLDLRSAAVEATIPE